MSNLDERIEKLRAASRQLVREFGFLGTDFHGVPHALCHSLIELSQAGCLTVAELAERLMVDRSTASRTVNRLLDRGWVRVVEDAEDRRRKPLLLCDEGRRQLVALTEKANKQVGDALSLLDEQQQATVIEGFSMYAKVLRKVNRRSEIEVRAIKKKDNPQVANIIRTVLTEYGAACSGFAFADPELDAMFEAYAGPGKSYLVAVKNGRVIGGAGLAPLKGGSQEVCELQKMYVLPEGRGLGLGALFVNHLLQFARTAGYRTCYLETLTNMKAAQRLYGAMGFQRLEKPMGATGHYGCNSFYALELKDKKAGEEAFQPVSARVEMI